MARDVKNWFPLTLASVVALAVGYVLPRSPRPGDMLDAIAAVQRRSPYFLVSEPMPPANWARTGAVYLCRSPRTAADLDLLNTVPRLPDDRWTGVVCFRGTAEPRQVYVRWASEGSDRCLDYGTFAVFGDPDLLEEVQPLLADAGFQAKPRVVL